MNQLANVRRNEITDFKPEMSKERISVLQAAIQHAKNMEAWEPGWEAVDRLIEEQARFVKWWEGAVSVRHGAGRGNKKSADPGTFSMSDAEEATGITNQQVSRWRKQLAKADKYREILFGVAHSKAMADEHNHRAQGTGENEWYTPTKYIEMARAVLGEIDLDPASNEIAQQVVQARRWCSVSENGLTKQWTGRVWLNPPYAQPLIGQFVSKMVEERAAERVTAAIMLTHNYTDTGWFHEACEIADAICFTRGRIKFISPSGDECAPTQGQAFFYFGSDVAAFGSLFKDIGIVTTPYGGEV